MSIVSTFGRCSLSFALTAAEYTAPPEPTDTTADRSYDFWSSASPSGRAIASPTTMTVIARSRSASPHASCGSKPCGVYSTTLPPPNSMMHMPHWAAPCMIGASVNEVTRPSSGHTRPAISSGAWIGGWPKPPPPKAAKKMSSWRHITPFGVPVVPPV